MKLQREAKVWPKPDRVNPWLASAIVVIGGLAGGALLHLLLWSLQ